MDLQDLIHRYQTDPRAVEIASALQHQSEVRLHLQGLVGSQQAFVAAGIYRAQPQSHLFVLETKDEAIYFQNDLRNLFELKKDVLLFPDSFKNPEVLTRDKLEREIPEVNKTNVLLRTETLSRLLSSHTTGELLVTYPEALFERVVNTKALRQSTLHIEVKDTLDTAFILEMLVNYGFEHADFVYEPGQFSVRGGIVDIYSFGNDLPYRVELFGNEVESIRVFDPLTQLSVKKIARSQHCAEHSNTV